MNPPNFGLSAEMLVEEDDFVEAAAARLGSDVFRIGDKGLGLTASEGTAYFLVGRTLEPPFVGSVKESAISAAAAAAAAPAVVVVAEIVVVDEGGFWVDIVLRAAKGDAEAEAEAGAGAAEITLLSSCFSGSSPRRLAGGGAAVAKEEEEAAAVVVVVVVAVLSVSAEWPGDDDDDGDDVDNGRHSCACEGMRRRRGEPRAPR